MPIFDIIGGSFPLPSKGVSSQRTLNYIVEEYGSADLTKVRRILKCLSGMDQVTSVSGSGRCRGQYVSSTGRLYGVYATQVIRWRAGLTAYDVIGTVTSSNSMASMTDNGFDFILVIDGVMYSSPLDAIDGSVSMSGVSLPQISGNTIQPTHVAFINQRLVVNTGNTNQWMYSDLASTTIQDDSFYTAESSADPIVAIKVCDGSVWVMGSRSFEVWRTQDDQDDPFTFVGGNAGAIGCASGSSVAVIGNDIYWLGGAEIGSSGVYRGRGITAERVSDIGIEYLISTFSNRSDTIGYCYSKGGIEYYVLTFITGDYSIGYSPNGGWHERSTKDLANSDDHAHSALYIVNVNDRLIAGCYYNRSIYEFTDSKASDFDGRSYRRERVCPVMASPEANEIIINEMLLDMDVGTTQGVSSNPTISLEVSRDGGWTFGTAKNKSVGTQGNYRKVVRWMNLGSGRSVVMRLKFDSVDTVANIFQARVDYAECVNS